MGLQLVTERHFTPKELAELWNLSETTIRKLFRDRSGVIKHGKPFRSNGNGYVSLRIPESVAAEVHKEIAGR